MGIPIGAILNFKKDPEILVTVIAPRKVRMNEQETSLTAVTQQLLGLGYATAPVPHWLYEGRSHSEIYEETYTPSE